jgi:hypothetical protein
MARFLHHAFTLKLLDQAGFDNMTKHLHAITDGFAVGVFAYGLGMEAMMKDGKPSLTQTCGMDRYGHAGVDYGSGGILNGYFPKLKLGISFAMDTAGTTTASALGMNCSLRYPMLSRATEAVNELLDVVVTEIAGLPAPCGELGELISYEMPPADECKDAPSFGKLNDVEMTCGQMVEYVIQADASKGISVSADAICGAYLSRSTLAGMQILFALEIAKYFPPSGYNPNTTSAVTLCNSTCGAVGYGKCWMHGARQPWCEPPEHATQEATIAI